MQNKKIIKTVALMLCVMCLGFVENVFASPSSNVAWTIETRNLIRNADLANGKKIASKCSKCHGKDGTDSTSIEEEDTPFLSGQLAHTIYKQIIDYKDKKRSDSIMRKKVKKLSKQDAADVSAFYASQALPMPSVDASKVTKDAIRMVNRGAGDRFIPPCAACHGINGEGSIVDVPALAGQNTSYFITTMSDFKGKDRKNDIYSRMRFIAQKLSDKEITELADYYASIGTGTKLLVVDDDDDD